MGPRKLPVSECLNGRSMLVPASLFQTSQAVAFRAEKRLYPIYFDYPFEETDDLTLHVPTWYKIESAPAASEAKRRSSRACYCPMRYPRRSRTTRWK